MFAVLLNHFSAVGAVLGSGGRISGQQVQYDPTDSRLWYKTHLRVQQFDDRTTATAHVSNGGTAFDRQLAVSRQISGNGRPEIHHYTHTQYAKHTKTVSMAASDIRHFCSWARRRPATALVLPCAVPPALPLSSPAAAGIMAWPHRPVHTPPERKRAPTWRNVRTETSVKLHPKMLRRKPNSTQWKY